MTKLFSQRALQKRHHVGDRDGPVTLLTPPLRATLALGALIAISGSLWATLARIPVSVQGTGVLLPVSTINSSLSATDGAAVYMFNKPHRAWHDKARRFMHSPDQFSDQDVASLAREIYQASQSGMSVSADGARMTSSRRFARILEQKFKGLAVPKGRLLIWVHSSAELERLSSAIDQLQRVISNSEQEEANISSKQDILKREYESRFSYLENMKELASQGYVNRQTILNQQSQVANTMSQIHSNDTELIRISSRRDQAYQKLKGELANVISQQLIYAPKDVYLSSLIPNDGESVVRGKVLMELSDNQLDQPVMVPVFLSSKQRAQVFPGMEALATPSGYKRSEVGGIKGRVVSMANLPSGVDEVTARIGVKAMAQIIVSRHPSPTLAILALQRSGASDVTNSGGYQWSSNSELPFPPSPGDRLNVEITTRRVAPIALVLPAIRSFFGIAPPDQPDPGSSPGTPSSRQPNAGRS